MSTSNLSQAKTGEEITGSTIALRRFTIEDITPSYLSWLNDKELMRFSEQSRNTHTRESSLEYLQSFNGSSNYFWSVYRLSDKRQIGTLTAYVDEKSQVADIGILMGDASARGKGLAKQAWGLALNYLFSELGLRKVTGGTIEDNLAMINIFEYHKMTREGLLREQQLLGSKPFNIALYGLLQSEWTQNKHLT
jgi:RimJ/RimL family protein N-acetyltransferase